jgi:hypothetical protein
VNSHQSSDLRISSFGSDPSSGIDDEPNEKQNSGGKTSLEVSRTHWNRRQYGW